MRTSTTHNLIGFTSKRTIRISTGWVTCHGWGFTSKSSQRRLERVIAEVIQSDL